ncbi:MAG TPA: type IV toxin-antitoxin system AbiEi family antitoxin domain-containing protein [Thermoanaerobaculia bacterium]|nr:type IV toxin-antitoxin system AbiEi family antitoxin domain-containing protein [Thermoanaerobaculia bacterium]
MTGQAVAATRDPKETLRRLARGSHAGLVTTERSAELLGVGASVASLTLGRLVRRGWLARVRRGLYLILPLEAGREATAIEDPWALARELYSPCYIGGWTAAEHWGLSEQLFRATFVVTCANIRRARETFLGAEFHLTRGTEERVAQVGQVWRGRERVAVSDRERTIADALANPSWVGGVRHLVEILRTYRESKEWNPSRLIERLDEIGSGASFKRIGYLAETILESDPLLVNEALARRTSGVVKLDPAIAVRGRINTRWGLSVNVPLKRIGLDA